MSAGIHREAPLMRTLAVETLTCLCQAVCCQAVFLAGPEKITVSPSNSVSPHDDSM